MRSALIIVSFALTLLAAPVPVTEGQAPAIREAIVDVTPTEAALDTRLNRNRHGELKGSRAILEEAQVDKRVNRKNYLRSEEDDVEVEKRVNRKNYRSEEDDAEVEKRVNRKNYRSEEDADVEKRVNRKNYRSEEDADVEKRVNRKNYLRSEEDDAEVEKRVNRKNYLRSDDVVEEKRETGFKPAIRSVYNNMVGIIEAIKSRGFVSSDNIPAREAI